MTRCNVYSHVAQDYTVRLRRKPSAVASLLTAGCACAAILLVLFCFFQRRLCGQHRLPPADDTSSIPDIDGAVAEHVVVTPEASDSGQYNDFNDQTTFNSHARFMAPITHSRTLRWRFRTTRCRLACRIHTVQRAA